MATKPAYDLQLGDAIDIGGDVRSVEGITWHPTGIPETAVVVTWHGRDGQSIIRADKAMTIARPPED